MDYNLAHALFGRFGILIPLLGLFFEGAALFTKKELVSYIAGFIVIVGGIIAVLAGVTGIAQLKDLAEPLPIGFHYIAGYILSGLFTTVIILRCLLFKYKKESLYAIYILLLVIAVLSTLINNEFTAHILYRFRV